MPRMKNKKLNYIFHNPNKTAETADYILKIMLEANADKVESAIKKAADEKCVHSKKSKEEHTI